MPRKCTICEHAQVKAINKEIVNGTTLRNIAKQFSVSYQAVGRHKQHIRETLTSAQISEETDRATNIRVELKRCFERINLLFDACDRWLRDADDPTRYDIGPRDHDVIVTYYEPGNRLKSGKAKKAPVSVLLARIEKAGYCVESWEIKHADPRELVLKTAKRLQGQIELLSKIIEMENLEERLGELELLVKGELN